MLIRNWKFETKIVCIADEADVASAEAVAPFDVVVSPESVLWSVAEATCFVVDEWELMVLVVVTRLIVVFRFPSPNSGVTTALWVVDVLREDEESDVPPDSHRY